MDMRLAGPWLEMEGWGVLLLILPAEGRGLGVAFAFFLEEKKDLTY